MRCFFWHDFKSEHFISWFSELKCVLIHNKTMLFACFERSGSLSEFVFWTIREWMIGSCNDWHLFILFPLNKFLSTCSTRFHGIMCKSASCTELESLSAYLAMVWGNHKCLTTHMIELISQSIFSTCFNYNQLISIQGFSTKPFSTTDWQSIPEKIVWSESRLILNLFSLVRDSGPPRTANRSNPSNSFRSNFSRSGEIVDHAWWLCKCLIDAGGRYRPFSLSNDNRPAHKSHSSTLTAGLVDTDTSL